MEFGKYKPGAAMCPECTSVLEYFSEKCPWCNHLFTGKEALKILSMLAETGVEAEDLLGQIRDAGPLVGELMLPHYRENFERGGEGAKLVSLLVAREYGDLSELPVASLEEGYKKSSNAVKIQIIRTLAKGGTPEAARALAALRDLENDPEVLLAFSSNISDEKATRREEGIIDLFSQNDLEVKTADGISPDSRLPLQESREEVSPPSLLSSAVPSAEEIIPPLPSIPPRVPATVAEAGERLAKDRSMPSRVLATMLVLLGFIVTGAIVLVVLVFLDIKVPVRKKGEGDLEEKEKKIATAILKKRAEEIPQPKVGEAAASTAAQADTTPRRLDFVVTASSQHKRYPAANITDGNPTTVWQEAKGEKAVGQRLTLSFGGEVSVVSMAFITGYDDPQGERGDMFLLNNRLKKIEVQFSDGVVKELEFKDKREKQTHHFDPPMRTSEIVITVLECYTGSWFNDNAVAEVEVVGFTK